MATLLYCLVCIISISQTFLGFLFISTLLFRVRKKTKTVCIVVLGDIGRSPRMQYHAKSLVEEGYKVNFVGYSGTSAIASLQDNGSVSFTYLKEWSNLLPLPSFVNYLLKAIFYAIQLFVVLFIRQNPSHFLVQNPPSIPSLSIVWIISCIKGSIFIIDWHNYGYTILSMNVKNKKHPLVRFSKWYEGFFGCLSNENICVTNAMKQDLKTKWNVEANVLYDKPPDSFQEMKDPNVKQELFHKLQKDGVFDEYKEKKEIWESISKLCSLTNEMDKSPAVVISSTSWTEDEDFSILLDALKFYEGKKSSKVGKDLPPLLCIITGKGPLKEHYKSIIKKLQFKYIAIITPWLSSEDYPKVIAAADVGICLHFSSSGLDLPMKVVDMFGCCLPVCAVNFSCLDELVKHEKNGFVFGSGDDLADQMIELLTGFPHCKTLEKFRSNIKNGFQKERWHDNWKNVMLPILNK